MQRTPLYITLISFMSFSHILSMSSSSKDFDSFRIFFWGEDLSLKSLQLTNFTGCVLRSANLDLSSCDGASFIGTNLNKVKARKTTFVKAKFYKANLEDGDFPGANFSNAILLKTNLSGAIFASAIFTNARGLTNEQKQYLRDQGAKEVPLDISEEQFLEEKHKIKEDLKSPIIDAINNFLDRIFCCCKKHKKHKS